VFLHATLNPSRNTIVDNGVMGEQTSIDFPVTVVHCIAIARQNVLDLYAI
jgi:hypothetical protein